MKRFNEVLAVNDMPSVITVQKTLRIKPLGSEF